MTFQPNDDRELVLDLLLDAPREKIYRAWTDPELMKQWFVPAPWGSATLCELDVRPVGKFRTIMRAHEGGEEYDNNGVFLEVVPNEKIVTTDAFHAGWVPSAKPFMTATLLLSDEDGKTRYRVRCSHWTVEDRQAHEQMGFHDGWTLVANQLADLARTL